MIKPIAKSIIYSSLLLVSLSSTTTPPLPFSFSELSHPSNPLQLSPALIAAQARVLQQQHEHCIENSNLTPQLQQQLLGYFKTTTLYGHTKQICALAFSPDGRLLASGSWDKTIKLWGVSDPHNLLLLATLEDHDDGINTVAFSPDNRLLASGSVDKTIKLWDISNILNYPHNPQPLTTLRGHTHWINSVAFSPNNRLLASGSTDTTINLWDVNNILNDPENPRPLITLKDDMRWVNTVAFSPDSNLLASGSADRAIKFWDVNNILNDRHTPQPLTTLKGHTRWINTVAFSPDGRLLASGSADTTINLWDMNNIINYPQNLHILSTLQDHEDIIYALIFPSNGRLLASGSFDNTIKLWDLAQGIKLFATINNNHGVEALALSPVNDILCCNQDNNIAVYAPYWTLRYHIGIQAPDYIACLVRWYRDKPSFEDLSDEDKAILAEMPAGAHPDWLTNSMNNQMP